MEVFDLPLNENINTGRINEIEMTIIEIIRALFPRIDGNGEGGCDPHGFVVHVQMPFMQHACILSSPSFLHARLSHSFVEEQDDIFNK